MTQMFFNEINNGFLLSTFHILSIIVEMKILVNVEEFKFLQKIDNDIRVLLKQIEEV